MTHPPTEKQKLWQSHLDAAHASGLSLSKYARQHDLPPKQLYAWSFRLKRMSTPAIPAHQAFVRVDATPRARTPVEVNLPNGIQLRMTELTADLLRMLQAL